MIGSTLSLCAAMFDHDKIQGVQCSFCPMIGIIFSLRERWQSVSSLSCSSRIQGIYNIPRTLPGFIKSACHLEMKRCKSRFRRSKPTSYVGSTRIYINCCVVHQSLRRFPDPDCSTTAPFLLTLSTKLCNGRSPLLVERLVCATGCLPLCRFDRSCKRAVMPLVFLK